MKKIISYIVFYLLQFTWGLTLNIIGAIGALIMLCMGYKPYKCGPFVYFKCKQFIGSFSAGIFLFIADESMHTALHESGHSVQNLVFGPIFIFITIWSICRFWYRQWYNAYRFEKTGKILPPYESIWFEKQATDWGTKYFTHIWSEHKIKKF